MVADTLSNRLRALEDEFFYQVDLKLGEQLREQSVRKEKRKRLSEKIKVNDEATLNELIDRGIDEQTVAALQLVPLVFVAWADGRMTAAEQRAVVDCIAKYTRRESDALLQIAKPWLTEKPSETLWDAWSCYIQALRSRMSSTAVDMMSDELLNNASRVAEASTSFLSLRRVCPDKQRELDRLSEVLKADC